MRAADADPKNLDLIRIDSPEQVEYGDLVYERVQFGIGPQHVKYNVYRVEEVQRKACVVTRMLNDHGQGRARSCGITGGTLTRMFNNLLIERKIPPVPDNINTPFTDIRKLSAVPHAEPVKPEPPPPPPVANEAFAAWVAMGESLLADIGRDREALARQRAAVENDVDRHDNEHAMRITDLEAQLEHAKASRERDAEAGLRRLEALDHRLAALESKSAVVEKIRQCAAQ